VIGRAVAVLALGWAGLAGVPGASAQARCAEDPVAVETARRAANREAARAATWNRAWAIVYGVAAAGQVGLALAEISPGREFERPVAISLYAGAGKAVIGLGTRLILPLELPRVAASGDPCVDAAAVRAARATAARKEQNAFWLQLGGGAALHVAVGGYLVIVEDAWRDALMSLAIGAVVSGVTLYTLPKRSWRSAPALAVAPVARTDSLGVSVVGSF
jgi:hypothetical protein